MSILENSKVLLSLANAEGKINKLEKLIRLDQESLSRPDGFLNRHAKIKVRLAKYYAELEAAENNFRNMGFINK